MIDTTNVFKDPLDDVYLLSKDSVFKVYNTGFNAAVEMILELTKHEIDGRLFIYEDEIERLKK